MRIQYTLIAVFSLLTFAVCSESDAQFFRQRFRQPAQPTYNAYSNPQTVSQTQVYTQPAIVLQPSISTRPESTVRNSVSTIQTVVPVAPTVVLPNKTQDVSNRRDNPSLRHVYRPIKGGMTKEGGKGNTLILAEYIGTHLKTADEKVLGEFHDVQHGNMEQTRVNTNMTETEMWVEPVLDGTLRWVPLVYKN